MSASKAPAVECEKLHPSLIVRDVLAAVDFYSNRLGFTPDFTWGDPVSMAGVSLSQVQIFLEQGTPWATGFSVYLVVDNADAFHAFHQANGVTEGNNHSLGMMRGDARTITLAKVTPPRFPAREFPKHVDVVIVGGGTTGLTAAALLKRAGKRVLLLERERIGAGETGSTSAHLTYVTDRRLTDLVERFGKDAARLTWEGGATAIDLIESHVEQLNIACGFQRVPGLVYSARDSDNDESDALCAEYEAANELGFPARFLRAGPLKGRPAASYPDQAILHPITYLAGLARAVDSDGSMPRADIERRWSGQVIETNDGLPYIGKTAEHQLVATGYAGNGLTFGTLAGILAHDFVFERSNPWQDLFDPGRKELSAGSLTTLVRENIDYPLHFVLDRLRQNGKAMLKTSSAATERSCMSTANQLLSIGRTPASSSR